MIRRNHICHSCRAALDKGFFDPLLPHRRKAGFSTLTTINEQLIHIHTLTALPWSLTIPLATAVLSVITFPIAYKVRKNQNLMLALSPAIQSSTTDLRQRLAKQGLSMQQFEAEVQKQSKLKIKEIKRRHRVTVSWLLLPVAVKLPIWFSFSLTLRAMSGSAIPYLTAPPLESSLQHDPTWWTSADNGVVDLTRPDSLMILPFLFSLITLVNLELQTSQNPAAQNKLSKIFENAGRIVAIAMIPIAGQMPSIVCEYWTTSALLNLLQNLYLSSRFPKAHIVDEKLPGTKPERLVLPGVDDYDESSTSTEQDKKSK